MAVITDRDGKPYNVDQKEIKRLEYICELVRRNIIETLYKVGRGHSGPSLSLVEVVVTLYFKELRLDPQDPKWPDRDRFILSKGHGAVGFYSVLAERGLIPREELDSFESLGTRLQGSVDSIWLPWVELTTGSLGQGLSVSLGIAMGAKRLEKNVRSYCMMGDGETQEGNVWEAAMCAAKYKQDNLLAIVDWNGLQGGKRQEVMPSMEPYSDKWEAFGWHVIEIPGHDVAALLTAYHEARRAKEKPTIIVAHTVKGKGVSYMENKAEWHAGYVTKPLYEQAMSEINARIDALSEYSGMG
ncbi:MAG: transketolase [Dehalococcoidales bacterium]|jgi:transketolase|nr:transketolase [Dehalococcoidales bacterium]|tara:strand:+ start:2198 stop:3094 length:897 start_codon:yes stop_codon:yes gene_type:complete